MRTLLDTNILLRSGQPSSPHHAAAVASVAKLLSAGRSICISSQTIYEFLAVATRPVSENGLGMPPAEATAQLTTLLAGLEVYFDSPEVAESLQQLVVAHDVKGKQVHDARLVAAMGVNQVSELLTFNGSDFKRFVHIVLLVPDAVASGTQILATESAP